MRNRTIATANKWLLSLAVFLVGCSGGGQDSSQKASLPEQDSAGAKLVAAECSQCHVTPKPKEHTAQEWPSVVERMQRRRVKSGMPALSGEEMTTVVAYLQAHAKKDDHDAQ